MAAVNLRRKFAPQFQLIGIPILINNVLRMFILQATRSFGDLFPHSCSSYGLDILCIDGSFDP